MHQLANALCALHAGEETRVAALRARADAQGSRADALRAGCHARESDDEKARKRWEWLSSLVDELQHAAHHRHRTLPQSLPAAARSPLPELADLVADLGKLHAKGADTLVARNAVGSAAWHAVNAGGQQYVLNQLTLRGQRCSVDQLRAWVGRGTARGKSAIACLLSDPRFADVLHGRVPERSWRDFPHGPSVQSLSHSRAHELN